MTYDTHHAHLPARTSSLAGYLLAALSVAAACSASNGGDNATTIERSPASTTSTGTAQSTSTSTGATSTTGSPILDAGIVDLTSTTTAGDAEEPNCGEQHFMQEASPAEVLLVLDRSASMQDPPSDDVDISKWELTVPAVNQVVLETNAQVHWGLKTFPESQDTEACSPETISDVIHIPIAENNAQVVVDAILMTTDEGDGTPTGDAIHAAVAYLDTLTTTNPKFILLATDGEPSCSPSGEGQDDARPYAVDAISTALSAGYPTFVVGVATTKDSATEALNSMAVAGGRPRDDEDLRYYLATTEAELVAALNAIVAGEIATCVFPLASKPPVVDNIAVKVNGVKVPQDTTKTEGWDYVDAELTAVEVFGSWCDEIKNNASNTAEIIFGCPGVEIK